MVDFLGTGQILLARVYLDDLDHEFHIHTLSICTMSITHIYTHATIALKQQMTNCMFVQTKVILF